MLNAMDLGRIGSTARKSLGPVGALFALACQRERRGRVGPSLCRAK